MLFKLTLVTIIIFVSYILYIAFRQWYLNYPFVFKILRLNFLVSLNCIYNVWYVT